MAGGSGARLTVAGVGVQERTVALGRRSWPHQLFMVGTWASELLCHTLIPTVLPPGVTEKITRANVWANTWP